MGIETLIIGAVIAIAAAAVIIMSRPSMPSMPPMPSFVSETGNGSYAAAASEPSFGSSAKISNQLAATPTYGWDGIRNSTRAGSQVPIVYGQHRVGGVILNVYKETVGDNQYLNMLIALSEGRIDGVSGIEINNNPIENYYGVWHAYRWGLNDQTPIEYFQKIVTEYSQNAKITTGGYTYTTRGTGIQACEVFVQFPQGLYAIDSREDTANYIADLGAESLNVSGQISGIMGEISWRQGEITRMQGEMLSLGPTDPLIPELQANNMDHSINILRLQGDISGLQSYQTDLGWRQNNASRSLASSAYISWSVTWRIEYRLKGQTAWTQGADQTVVASQKTAVRRSIKIDGLAAGQYDIRISRVSPDHASFRIVDDLWLTAVDEIVPDDLAYPNTALLAVRALATDQLNGSMPTVTTVVKGVWCQVWNGIAWEEKWTNNPAWIVYDILTRDRYGLGNYIDAARVDTDSFYAAAQWCDELVDDYAGGTEPRCRWDGVLEGSPAAWDLLTQVASTFGGTVLYSDGTYKLRVSKPETSSQLFTMGNIVAGSFSGGYLSADKRTNAVDVQYTDVDQNYSMELIPVETEAAFLNAEPIRKESVSLVGIVRRSQAIREGQRMLNVSRLVRRKIEFSAAVDSIACEALDVISFSHDVPQWGFSGRSLRAIGRRVHLDQSVTIQSGKTYLLRVRHSADDTVEEKTVVTGPGTVSWVEVSSDWASAVVAGDLFAFGESGKVVKDFRVTSISRDSELAAKIEAWEYNSGIWSYDNIVLEAPNVSSLPNPLIPPDPVTDLSISERLYFNQAGEINAAIDVWFNKPLSTEGLQYTYDHADIYFSEDYGATWLSGGTAIDKHAVIPTVVEGKTYKIAVVAVSVRGAKRAIAEEPQASLFVQGKSKPPAAVTDLAAIQQGDTILLSWTVVNELDIYGYEIREGATWNAGIPVAVAVTGNSLLVPRGVNGTYRFWVKAFDTTGHYSDSVSVQITVSGLSYNAVLSREEMTVHDGIGTDLTYFSELSGLINPAALTDQNIPTRTDQDAAISSYAGGSFESHVYETQPFDQGKIAISNVTVQLSITATDPSLTDQTYPSRTDQTYPNDTDQAVTAEFATTVEINLSDDGSTWGGWQAMTNGAYSFRFIKWRITIGSSVTARVLVTSMIETIDVPDVEFWVTSFAVGIGGSAVTYSSYGKTYFQTPNVSVTSVGGSFALPVVSGKSATGCTVTLYDAAGASIAGTVDAFVDGY